MLSPRYPGVAGRSGTSALFMQRLDFFWNEYRFLHETLIFILEL